MATIILSLTAESFDDRIYAKNVNISTVQKEMVSYYLGVCVANGLIGKWMLFILSREIPPGEQSSDKYVESIIVGS